MLFAGLSSAVLVRKMDKFWVNIHLPFAFKISTLLILVSSIFIYLALKKARLSDKKKTIYYLLISLVLSLFFAFFQFQGWNKYYQQGNAVKSFITFVYGQYGQSYQVYDQENPIEYDGENYIKKEQILNEEEINKLKLFLRQICGYGTTFEGSNLSLSHYNDPFTIYDVKNKMMLENNQSGLTIDGKKFLRVKKMNYLSFPTEYVMINHFLC